MRESTRGNTTRRLETSQECSVGAGPSFHVDLLPCELLDLMREADVIDCAGELWRSRIRVSSLDGDLFVHSAYPTVSAESVFFGPDTYRFAAEIRAHLHERGAPIRRAVDIGCGAGPGAILVAKANPTAEVAMVDINETALRYARINAGLAGVPNAFARRSDLLSGLVIETSAGEQPFKLPAGSMLVYPSTSRAPSIYSRSAVQICNVSGRKI